MCKKCSKNIKLAVKRGMPEADALNWLWECTPYPVGSPTNEQWKELEKISQQKN